MELSTATFKLHTLFGGCRQGLRNYLLYLRLLAQLDRERYLAVEHLTLADVPAARDYVLGQFEKV